MREAGIAKETARKIRNAMDERIICDCGLDNQHQGWCRPRVAKSVHRSAFLAEWSSRYRQRPVDNGEKAKKIYPAARERSITKQEIKEWKAAKKAMQKITEYLYRL